MCQVEISDILLIRNNAFQVSILSRENLLIYNIDVEVSKLFSRNLVRFRKLKNLSQRKLAEETGLTQRMINIYENSPNSIPVNKLSILAEALEVGIQDFFERKNNDLLDKIDERWLKKLAEIKELPESNQKAIVHHMNVIIENHRFKLEKSKA